MERDAARKRAAVETYAQNETTLRRTARRFSLCHDDADEALQRSLEILLRKAPSEDPRHLIKWMQTVVKREAMALRRERERIFAGPAALEPDPGKENWVNLLPTEGDGPPERAEREETVARSREALRALKPHELRALSLLAHGYSYVEIGEITGFSATKINRSLAEGRERFRRMVARSEGGERCGEMKPLISAFCDGEVKAAEVAELRAHLRACAHCRATLRAYRAAPAAAAATLPVLPLHRSLWERVHDAFGELARRFGDSAPGTATGGGLGGTGFAGLAKVATLCIGAAGGATACIAGGLVPSPLATEHERPARLERHLTEAPERRAPLAKVTYEPAPPPEPAPKPKAAAAAPEPPAESELAAEPAPVVSNEAVEYEPPPAPEPEPEPVTSSAGASPAGEFGP